MVPSLRKFSADEVTQERLKIIQFYDAHGEAETLTYFHVNRKTIHVWKRRLAQAQGHLAALGVQSTRPKHVRRMTTDPRVVQFIRQLRETHPRLGKTKIKPLLDAHCQMFHLPSVSVSTIGKVLRRHRGFWQPRGRVYHDPKSHFAQQPKPKPPKRQRVRYAPKPEALGYLQMDTMERVVDGLKVHFYSAIDVKGKFAFALPYRQCTSENGRDFYTKVQHVYPLKIRAVQTDNGAEFLGAFDAQLQEQQVKHLFSYPRCPKINGCVERFQRTLNEEFLQVHEELIRTPSAFHLQLAQFLIFYNCHRAHLSLDLQSPMNYLVAQQQLSKMSVTRTDDCVPP
jgi:putative transposase